MGVLLAIGKVASKFGVTTQTIRNWVKQGKFQEKQRTMGGHRRFDEQEIKIIQGCGEEEDKSTIIYSRVSGHDQKEDLGRQTEELKNYCKENKIEKVEVIEDIGSGINYKKKGLQNLIRKIIMGEVKQIVVSFQDRLVRFGNEILQQLCELKQVEIVVLHNRDEKSFEYRLAEDVLAILTVYSSKIYGKRSHQKKLGSLSQFLW